MLPSISEITLMVLASALIIAAHHKRSPISVGRKNKPPNRGPYCC